jgi:hypothetical protein
MTGPHLPVAKAIPMDRIRDPSDPLKVFSLRLKTATVKRLCN